MIYIITHETSECCHPYTTDILFTSTNEDVAKKAFDEYKEFPHNDDYDCENYVLYEYPEMDTINYPFKDMGTIIDRISL